MRTRAVILLLVLFFLFCYSIIAGAGEVKKETKQLLLGIAPGWNSSHVTLAFYERGPLGKWNKVDSWKGRLGKNGLAWGLGLHDIPAGAKMKKEGDGRTPAGIFDIGVGAWGYAASSTIKRNPKLFYHQITTRSLWFEEGDASTYNSFKIIKHEPRTQSEKKAQMRQGDYAHSLKLFIAHNAQPNAKPGFGSAIFFHIWRGGGAKATAGCTTMPEGNLKKLIAQIDPVKKPRYVILPQSEYDRVKQIWQLP